MEPLRTNRDALEELLQLGGLLDASMARQVGDFSGQFPMRTEHNIGLEYELATGAVPAGLGYGFRPGNLHYYCHYAPPGHWFFNSPVGKAIRIALSEDPFNSVPEVGFNPLTDKDMDWVEYDIKNNQIDAVPFLFFRIPLLHRVLTTAAEVQALCRILPDCSRSSSFAHFLRVLSRTAPVRIYRVGVARQRGADWWRILLTNIPGSSARAALKNIEARNFSRFLDLADRVFDHSEDSPQFTFSVDVRHGSVEAVDLEYPYLISIKELASRRAALAQLLTSLEEEGIVSAAAAKWLIEKCFKSLITKDGLYATRFMVHHMKLRLFGPAHLRAKGYIHMEIFPRVPSVIDAIFSKCLS